MTNPSLPVRRTTWQSESLTLVPIGLVVAVGFELAASTGAGHLPLARACLVVLATQVLPGILIWRALRPRDGLLIEDLVLGTACGAALAVIAQVVAVATDAGFLAWLVPLGVAVVLIIVPATRRRIARARWGPLPWWWGLAMVLPLLMALRVTVSGFLQPISPDHGWVAHYVDLPYHLALTGELAHRFPPHSPQVADERLSYHWFSHAWMANIGQLSGTELEVVLFRFAPLLIACAVTVAIGVTAVRFARVPVAGPLAAWAALCVGKIAFWGLERSGAPVPFNMLSPSLGFGSLVVCVLAVLMAARWRGEVGHWTVAAVVPLAVVAGGAKGSVAPVLLVGCLVACLAALVARHRNRWTVAIDTIAVGAALGFLVTVLFAGNEGSMKLTPFTSLKELRGAQIVPAGTESGPGGTAVIVILLALSMILPFAGAFGVLRSRQAAADPAFWLLAGVGAAGMGAVLVLHHPAAGQVYFLSSAYPLLAVGLAWGLVQLATAAPRWWLAAATGALVGGVVINPLQGLLSGDGPHALRSAVLEVAVFLAILGVAAALVWLVSRRDLTAAALCVCMALVASASLLSFVNLSKGAPSTEPRPLVERHPGSFSAGQMRAARFLRNHSKPDDVVMTNRHCSAPRRPACDARRFYVAAYSERRVLVEGWAYTRRANNAAHRDPRYRPSTVPFWDPGLLALNDKFFEAPTAAAYRKLYARGVRWAFLDRIRPQPVPSLKPYATLSMQNRTAAVYRLRTPTHDEGTRP